MQDTHRNEAGWDIENQKSIHLLNSFSPSFVVQFLNQIWIKQRNEIDDWKGWVVFAE